MAPVHRRFLPLIAFLLASCSSGSGVAPEAGTPPSSAASTTAATASSTTSTAVAATTTTVPRAGLCDRLAPPVQTGTVADPNLAEISGVEASGAHDGVLWVHQDSGNPAEVVALARDGEVLGVVDVDARNVDWEDIALGPDGNLYLGDIGDNDRVRASVSILRFPEPDPADLPLTVVPEMLRFAYPDGPADAEAIAVDADGDVFVITKVTLGAGRLFRIPASAWDRPVTATAEAVGVVDLGLLGLVTAVDAAPDGSVAVVRTYLDVAFFAGDGVRDALTGESCAAPVPPERQGEAIALTPDGYVTIGEGANAPIWEASR